MKTKSLNKEKLSKVSGGAEPGRRNYFFIECFKCHKDQRDERRIKYKFTNRMDATACQAMLMKKKCYNCGSSHFKVVEKPFSWD